MKAALFTLFLFSLLHARGQASCVIEAGAKLRKGPSAKSEVIANLEKFTPVKLSGKVENKFYEVTDAKSRKGWLRTSQVNQELTCLTVKVEKSRLRSGPGTEYDPKGLAKKSEVFRDLGGEDGWTQVENARGEKAWINLDHTFKPRSKVRMSFEAD
ncbi:MAG: SH3 domain-containing protein [Pseudobdellovibrionaceae bacterium]